MISTGEISRAAASFFLSFLFFSSGRERPGGLINRVDRDPAGPSILRVSAAHEMPCVISSSNISFIAKR